MDNSFFTDIKIIRNAIDTKKLVVFAGAGISIDAGIPSWNTLIEEMKSEINIPSNEKDYLRIAQMYFNERQQKEYIDKIRSVLKHTKIKHNSIHEEISNLDPEHIITTNYDDLLEQVIKSKSLPFSIISKDGHFPYALNTKHLIKMHGDLSDIDIVLKEDDYIDYSHKHPLIEGFIKSVFVSKVVLFIGYGFSDINLKMIMQTVRNILGNDFQNAYLLNLDENFHPVQREYLKNKGVKVINYYDADGPKKINYITSYLKGENSLQEVYYKECKDLSEKGQNLLNFIRFIASYDKFNEPVSNKNVIDQIYDSLNRFSELKSLPPSFISNLYPFNNSKKYVDHYQNNSLITKNEKLHDLFFNQISYSDEGEVVFNPPMELKLTDSQIKEYEKKLKVIIEILNYGIIFYLFKENDLPDSFGNKGWSDTYKKLYIKHPDKCAVSYTHLMVMASEFQGITNNLQGTLEMIFDIEECIIENNLDFKLKHVLYHDTLESLQSKHTAYERLGFGLIDARERLDLIKKTDSRFLIATSNEKTSLYLNNLFMIYEDYLDSWKKNDFEYVKAFLNHMNYKEVAQLFNINISSGWRREKTLKMKQYYTIKEMILSVTE